jgi:hypothetical protein
VVRLRIHLYLRWIDLGKCVVEFSSHPIAREWPLAASGTLGSIFADGHWDPKGSAGPVGRMVVKQGKGRGSVLDIRATRNLPLPPDVK